jgi:signal transduction histidine kinase
MEMLPAWPLAASLAAVLTSRGLLLGRRRAALNEAVHELRRPLQALALAAPQGPGGVESSMRLVAVALERLDREINGGASRDEPVVVRVQPLLESAVARWRSRASLAGSTVALRWGAGQASVEGDGVGLSQAFDNLIVNAIEHGGPAIVVEARLQGERLHISVADSGRASRSELRRETPAEVLGRLMGRGRHGHGLKVVRRTAVSHRGRFALRRSERGSLALLELPLCMDRPDPAA